MYIIIKHLLCAQRDPGDTGKQHRFRSMPRGMDLSAWNQRNTQGEKVNDIRVLGAW